MDIHALLKLAGGLIAMGLYVPMIVEIIRARGAGQSFATWGLWAVLDSMLTITLWQQHGNYLLSLGFAVGGVVLSAVLLAQGGWAWGRFETTIALMVLAGVAVWKFSGPRNATIAVTVAVCIAGIPGFVEMLRKPQPAAGKLWAGFTVANVLAYFGGTAMTVEERLVPAAFTALSVLMVVACWWPQKK
ncbi:MAG: hypothetical protein PHY43_00470 [Verrucomicrobiales bacterium]|nr:hypothetical protein [Verrucomicrobiales bacterium]